MKFVFELSNQKCKFILFSIQGRLFQKEKTEKEAFDFFYILKFTLLNEEYKYIVSQDLIKLKNQIFSFKIEQLQEKTNSFVFTFVIHNDSINNFFGNFADKIKPNESSDDSTIKKTNVTNEKKLKIIYFEVDFDSLISFDDKSNLINLNKEYLEYFQLLLEEKFDDLNNMIKLSKKSFMDFIIKNFLISKTFNINLKHSYYNYINAINNSSNTNKNKKETLILKSLKDSRRNIRLYYQILNNENSLIFFKIKKQLNNSSYIENNDNNNNNLIVDKTFLKNSFGFIDLQIYKLPNFYLLKLLPYDNFIDFTGESFNVLAKINYENINDSNKTLITKLLIPNLERELVSHSEIMYAFNLNVTESFNFAAKKKFSYFNCDSKIKFEFFSKEKSENYLISYSNKVFILDRTNLNIKRELDITNQIAKLNEKFNFNFNKSNDINKQNLFGDSFNKNFENGIYIIKSFFYLISPQKQEEQDKILMCFLTNENFFFIFIYDYTTDKFDFIQAISLIEKQQFRILLDFKLVLIQKIEKSNILKIHFAFTDVNNETIFYLLELNLVKEEISMKLDFLKEDKRQLRTFNNDDVVVNCFNFTKRFDAALEFGDYFVKNKCFAEYSFEENKNETDFKPDKNKFKNEKFKINLLKISNTLGIYYGKAKKMKAHIDQDKADNKGYLRDKNNKTPNNHLKVLDLKFNEKENLNIENILEYFPELNIIFLACSTNQTDRRIFNNQMKIIIYDLTNKKQINQFALNSSKQKINSKFESISNFFNFNDFQENTQFKKVVFSKNIEYPFNIYRLQNILNGILIITNFLEFFILAKAKDNGNYIICIKLNLENLSNKGTFLNSLYLNNFFFEDQEELLFFYNQKISAFHYIDLKREKQNIEILIKTQNEKNKQNENDFIEYKIENVFKLEFSSFILKNNRNFTRNKYLNLSDFEEQEFFFNSKTKFSIFKNFIITSVNDKVYFFSIDFDNHCINCFENYFYSIDNKLDEVKVKKIMKINIHKLILKNNFDGFGDQIVKIKINLLQENNLILIGFENPKKDLLLYVYSIEKMNYNSDKNYKEKHVSTKLRLIKILEIPFIVYSNNNVNSSNGLLINKNNYENIATCLQEKLSLNSSLISELNHMFGKFLFTKHSHKREITIEFKTNNNEKKDIYCDNDSMQILLDEDSMQDFDNNLRIISFIVFEKKTFYFKFNLLKLLKSFSKELNLENQVIKVLNENNKNIFLITEKNETLKIIDFESIHKKFINDKLQTKIDKLKKKTRDKNKQKNSLPSFISNSLIENLIFKPKYKLNNMIIDNISYSKNGYLSLTSFNKNNENTSSTNKTENKTSLEEIYKKKISIFNTKQKDQLIPVLNLHLDLLCSIIDFDLNEKINFNNNNFLNLFILISYPEDWNISSLDNLSSSNSEMQKAEIAYAIISLKINLNNANTELNKKINFKKAKNDFEKKIFENVAFILKDANFSADSSIEVFNLHKLENHSLAKNNNNISSIYNNNNNLESNKKENEKPFIFNKIKTIQFNNDDKKNLLLAFSEYGYIELFIFDDFLKIESKLKFNFTAHVCDIAQIKNDYANRKDMQNLFYLNEKFNFLQKFEFYNCAFFDFNYNKNKKHERLNRNELIESNFLLLFFNFGILVFEIITANDSLSACEDFKIRFYQQITFKSVTAKAYDIFDIWKTNSIIKSLFDYNNNNNAENIKEGIKAESKIDNLGLFANEKYEMFENDYHLLFDRKVNQIDDKGNFDFDYHSNQKDPIAFALDFNNKNGYKGYNEFHKERLSFENHLIAESLLDVKNESNVGERSLDLIMIRYNSRIQKFYID